MNLEVQISWQAKHLAHLEVHTHTRTHTHSHSHSLAPTHTHSPAITLTHALTHTHIHSHSHIHIHTHFRSRSHLLTLSLSHSQTLTNTHIHTHFFTLTLSLSRYTFAGFGCSWTVPQVQKPTYLVLQPHATNMRIRFRTPPGRKDLLELLRCRKARTLFANKHSAILAQPQAIDLNNV